MKQRIYIDTSVFGGFFDEEFEEFTRPLFHRLINGEFTILYSTLTQEELSDAPAKVQELVKQIKSEYVGFIEVNEDSIDLANQYIAEKVVGKTSFADCMHIAMATINNADLLISWNFKHIVNINRIRGYNSINIKLGFRQLEIRSPRDFMNYENED